MLKKTNLIGPDFKIAILKSTRHLHPFLLDSPKKSLKNLDIFVKIVFEVSYLALKTAYHLWPNLETPTMAWSCVRISNTNHLINDHKMPE